MAITKIDPLAAQFGRIAVLMGGPSTERIISLASGKAVYEALKQMMPEVVAIDIKTDNIEENIELIRAHKIDCAFIALHGRFGEDGQIQEMLDNLNISYTGSDRLASSLAMDKIASRKVFQGAGLIVPRYEVLEKSFYNNSLPGYITDNLILPLVVKPAAHGSSIGMSIVEAEKELHKAIGLAFTFDERIIIEEYIQGREVTVGILDDRALPVIEIVPKRKFFDYEAKYQPGVTEYIAPAQLEEGIAKSIQSIAMSAHNLLGCSGFSRVDMILSTEDIPYVLELNSIPGLTTTSLLPKAAKVAGIEFDQLCLNLIRLAYEKAKDKITSSPDKVTQLSG
ncbi:MAG: D-alanine--D-alanine ligase [Candidatus Omnitrophica bacterium]|nr:D-alanine--D-alanine ligase [Candidatus Omnitrophota bacterium]